MTRKQDKTIKGLGVFRIHEAEKLGISQQEISRMAKAGVLVRAGRGVYFHRDAYITNDVDFRIACLKFGSQSVIGGLSALFHYNLIEQVPEQTWVLVPPEVRTRENQYRLMRTKADLTIGVVEKPGYRMLSVERALLEGLRLSTKIGERTAIGAVRRAFAQKLTTEGKLGRMAKELGLVAHPVWGLGTDYQAADQLDTGCRNRPKSALVDRDQFN